MEKLAAGLGIPEAEVEEFSRRSRRWKRDERKKPTYGTLHGPNLNVEAGAPGKIMKARMEHMEALKKAAANKPIDDTSQLNKLCSLHISEGSEDPCEEIPRSLPSLGSVW